MMNMNYKEFVKHMKATEPLNVYVLYGKERYLVNWAVEALKEKYIPSDFRDFNFDKIDSPVASLETIINTCETLPMMSQRRMLVLEDFSILEGGKIKNFSEEDEKGLAKYLDQVPSCCIIIMTCGSKLDKRKALYKKLSKSGGIFEFNLLEPLDLKKWISKRFKKKGKEIQPAAIQKLIEVTGYYDRDSEYSLYNLENDIQKIIHFAGEEQEINQKTIMMTVCGNIERNIFDFIDAISMNKKSEAVKLLNYALLYGEAEYKILILLNRQFENLLHIKILKGNGKNIAYMKEKLSLPEFVVNKLIRVSNAFTLEKLKKINIQIHEADKNIKTGKIESRLALELLVAGI